MKLGLVEVWKNHGETLDFLIKADDDTFLVMDNLMTRLQGRDPERPFMMGHKLTNEVNIALILRWDTGHTACHVADAIEDTKMIVSSQLPCCQKVKRNQCRHFASLRTH